MPIFCKFDFSIFYFLLCYFVKNYCFCRMESHQRNVSQYMMIQYQMNATCCEHLSLSVNVQWYARFSCAFEKCSQCCEVCKLSTQWSFFSQNFQFLTQHSVTGYMTVTLRYMHIPGKDQCNCANSINKKWLHLTEI